MTNIYVIRLEGNRYYIGKSDEVLKRYQQHVNGYGSAWTRKYKPISLVKTISSVSPFEEDKITKEYMSKYGIDKVRGGSYVEVELSEIQKESLNKEIWAAKDLCTQCGRGGHFVKDCYARTDVIGNTIEYKSEAENEEEDEEEEEDSDDEDVWECEYCERTFNTKFGALVHEKSCMIKSKTTSNSKSSGSCYRCGRTGHYSPDCYASTHKNGYDL